MQTCEVVTADSLALPLRHNELTEVRTLAAARGRVAPHKGTILTKFNQTFVVRIWFFSSCEKEKRLLEQHTKHKHSDIYLFIYVFT